MRRTDEAFKNEVLRRYGVQKRNRRNLRLYAASTVMLLILAAFVTVPVATGNSLPAVVASWFSPNRQPNQFAEYLDQPINTLRVGNLYSNAFQDCTPTETEEVKDFLLKLSMTELLSVPDATDDTYHFVIMMETRQADIYAVSGGYLRVIYSGPGMDPDKHIWYQIPQNEYAALTEYADKILDKSIPVTTPDNFTREDPLLFRFNDYLQEPAQAITAKGVYLRQHRINEQMKNECVRTPPRGRIQPQNSL